MHERRFRGLVWSSPVRAKKAVKSSRYVCMVALLFATSSFHTFHLRDFSSFSVLQIRYDKVDRAEFHWIKIGDPSRPYDRCLLRACEKKTGNLNQTTYI